MPVSPGPAWEKIADAVVDGKEILIYGANFIFRERVILLYHYDPLKGGVYCG
ncbi:hypothetical protein JW968_04870 [Candidatus Woesearchaeota archaeon]|nr:hypothetical protein [Candidatus Woesearchaeota archaeon]